MKLPQLTAGGAPSPLAKKSLGGPAQVAHSQMNLAKAVGGLANQMAEQAATHQVQTAESSVIEQMSNWSAENDDVQYYDADDLRSRGVDEEIIRGRDTIAAYEVRPVLYKMESDRVISENSSKITPGKFRSDFDFKQDNLSFEEHASRVVRASQEQRTQENLEVLSDIKRLRQNGNYTAAIVRIGDLQESDDIKNDLILEVRDDREFGEYEQIVIRRGAEAIKDANDALKYLYKSFDRENSQGILKPGDKFQAAGQRSLDEKRTRQAIAMLEQYIHMYDPSQSGKGRDEITPVVRETMTAQRGMFGDRPDYPAVAQLEIDAENHPIQPNLIESFKATQVLNELTLGISMRPMDEQYALSKEFKENTERMTGRFAPAYSNVGDKAMSNQVSRNTAVQGDMMQYAFDASPDGMFAPVTPSMFGDLLAPGNADRFVMAIEQRIKDHDAIDDTFNTSRGYLSKDEVKQWTNSLNNMNMDQLIQTSAVISASFGRNADSFWEQMEDIDTFNPGTLSITGRMAIKNKSNVSEMIIMGKQKRVDYGPPLMKKIDFYDRTLNEKLAGAFLSDTGYAKSIREAILDVYVHLHPNVTGEWNDTADSNILDRAIALVTNGMHSHNGVIVELPDGVNGVTFDRDIKNATPQYWGENMGGINGETGESFEQRLKSEMYTFRNVGDNKYIVEDKTRVTSLGVPEVLLSNTPIYGPDGKQIVGYEV